MEKEQSILIIDDNREFCGFIKNVVVKQNIKCATCQSIFEAITTLKYSRPSLILLDVTLLIGYSLEFIHYFHFKYPEARLYLMTKELTDTKTIPEYVHGWLYKPFNEDELFAILHFELSSN